MKRILVIEDNQNIRENLAELLLLNGYEALTAANGKEGIETALVTQPDLLLCDISMPVMDGYTVLHTLKKDERIANIPLIFLTARADKNELSYGITEGARVYLVKPFTEDQLMQAINSGLGS